MRTVTDSTPESAPSATEDGPADRVDIAVMTLLHDHVPLALLCDLGLPDGPASAAILAEEGVPEVRWWEPAG